MALPSLLIFGAQKCGTSTLHALLCEHSQVTDARDPSCSKPVKEVSYFDQNWDLGIEWYSSHYPDPRRMGIDSTPNYLCDFATHPRAAAVLPDARVIISVRDPMRRAFSQFNHYTQNLPTTESWDWYAPGGSFQANVDAELDRPRDSYYGLLRRGCYIDQIEHLVQYFRREQILVIAMERWAADQDAEVERLLDFAGLPHEAIRPEPKHRREYTVSGMEDGTIDQLKDYYRPYNDRLFQWLGDSIPEWDS